MPQTSWNLLRSIVLLNVALAGSGARPAHAQPAPQDALEWPPALAFAEPEFPWALRHEPVYHGDVRLITTVDSAGRVLDALVVQAPHAAFATSVETVARSWRFAPAVADKAFASLPRRTTVQLRFEREGTLLTLSSAQGGAPVFAGRFSTGARQLARLDELDTPLRRMAGSEPAIHGEVAVRFVVDGTGQVRVPDVLKAREAADAAAVLAALATWRFAPPTREGRVVQVEGVRRFRPSAAP